MDRELFVRGIPLDVSSTEQIEIGPSLPPPAFTRHGLIDAALAVDPTARVIGEYYLF